MREHPDEGLAAAVSFETFLAQAARVRPRAAPGPGEVGRPRTCVWAASRWT
ncbi:hypothetical protein ACN28S_15740 [Cystobacter fuscus]